MSSTTSEFLALLRPKTARKHASTRTRRLLPGVLAAAAAAGFLTHGLRPRVLGTWGTTEPERAGSA